MTACCYSYSIRIEFQFPARPPAHRSVWVRLYCSQERKTHYFKIEHLLLYHYYGGMVYIGLKNFDRALQFLSVVRCSVLHSTRLPVERQPALLSLVAAFEEWW